MVVSGARAPAMRRPAFVGARRPRAPSGSWAASAVQDLAVGELIRGHSSDEGRLRPRRLG